MLGPDALVHLQYELRRAEWQRVRAVCVWSVFVDCRMRERRGAHGWARPLLAWGGGVRETRGERQERRAWYARLRRAQHSAAEAKWRAVADGGQALCCLKLRVQDLLVEQRAYSIVDAALDAWLTPELVRLVWEHLDMRDAVGWLGDLLAPWQHSTRRNTARRRWTQLMARMLRWPLHADFGLLNAGGCWDVLEAWRKGWQPWAVAQSPLLPAVSKQTAGRSNSA